MFQRVEFSPGVRLAIVHRANGACERCGKSVAKGGYHIDHVIPEGIARRKRQLTAADGQLLCVECHAKKTKADSGVLAKLRRLAEGVKSVRQSEIARRFGIEREAPPDD